MGDVDVFGNGPPAIIEDSDSDDGQQPQVEFVKQTQLCLPSQPKVDKLIQARIMQLQIKGRPQRLLVCLYDSNRLVQCTLHDNELHEVMLVEDMAGDRQRSDSPICFAVLQNHYCCD